MIETNRLIIRLFEDDDLQDLFEYSQQIEVTRPANMMLSEGIEGSSLMLGLFQKQGIRAIELKSEHKVIGHIGFLPKYLGEGLYDMDDVYVGYALNSNYWNQGFMSETLKAIMNIVANDYENIFAETYIDNIASQKVLIKNGFKQIGIHENQYLYQWGK